MALRPACLATIFAAAFTTPLRAEIPVVVTDIPPVASLVAAVMAGVGAQRPMWNGEGSAHDFQLRPSRARLLAQADLVVWVGPELSPRVGELIESLAPDASSLVLFDVEGALIRERREAGVFGGSPRTEHGDDHDGHHGHHHGIHDPHLWLDPANGAVWVDAISDALSSIDPNNAETYRWNALDAKRMIAETTESVRARIANLGGLSHIADHDALGYFESAFGLAAAGAISDADDAKPGPRRLRELENAMVARDVDCILTFPGGSLVLAETLARKNGARVISVDPLGRHIEPGPGLYSELLSHIAGVFELCVEI